MTARWMSSLREAGRYATSMVILAWVWSWFGHTLFGIGSAQDAVLGWVVLVVVMTPLLWLTYPLEMRHRQRREDARRARQGDVPAATPPGEQASVNRGDGARPE